MFSDVQHQLHLARAGKTFTNDADFLLRHVVDDMMERLGAVQRRFDHGIALFGRTAYLSESMRRSGQIEKVARIEEASWLDNDHPPDTEATLEFLDLAENSTDLILAPLALHWSNDLPGSLVQLHRALRPDGLLMAVLPGPDTLQELRDSLLAAESEVTGGAAMRVDPFTDLRDAGALLQRTGYALPVVDRDHLTIRYNTALDLIRDLRAFGATFQLENNDRPALKRQIFARMVEIYAERFSDPDGRIRATFSFVSMSGWVPHDSQQKPLKPGTAKTRLADALKTDEVKL